MDAAEAFGTTGDINVLFTEEFSNAAAAIYPTFQEGCGIPVVEALLTDYAFDGIPATLTSGPTAFVVHNNSEAGEAHEMLLIRVNDGVDLTAEELLALPDEELPQNATLVNAAFTPATDTTAGVVVNLTPGRYVYACFLAEGSVNGAEGSGPPHFMNGMLGEFTVELIHLKVNSVRTRTMQLATVIGIAVLLVNGVTVRLAGAVTGAHPQHQDPTTVPAPAEVSTRVTGRCRRGGWSIGRATLPPCTWRTVTGWRFPSAGTSPAPAPSGCG